MAELIAVAILLDSSINLSSNWSEVVQHYISPLLSGLIGPKVTPQMIHIAILTYATSDIVPSPIIIKRFFSHPATIVKELKEEPHKLGLGRTGSGGKGGMAVLEGYVAMLEMFDTFISLHADSVVTCHLIHVASSSPDNAQSPMWNQLPALDHVSWQNLPEELRKRNIKPNMILLQAVPQINELHAAIVPKPATPWFPTRSSAVHELLLAAPPVQHSINNKSTVDNTTEQKRARTASQNPQDNMTATPKLSLTTRGSDTTTAVNHSAAPKHPMLPSALANLPPGATNAIGLKIQELDLALKTDTAEYQLAMKDNRLDDAQRLKEQVERTFVQLRQYKSVYVSLVAARNAASANNTSSQNPGISTLLPENMNKVSSADVAGSSKIALSEQQTLTHGSADIAQESGSQHPSGGVLKSPHTIRPDVAVQMQKLLEQRGRIPQQSNTLSNPANSHLQSHQQQPIHQTSGPPVATTEQQIWRGSLSWSGSDPLTGLKREVSAQVIFLRTAGGNLMAETWPSNLSLIPTKETNVSIVDFQAWIKKHSPVICQVKPEPNVADDKANNGNFRQLHKMMQEKRVHATAMWQLPNGKNDYTMVLIPVPAQVNGAPSTLNNGMVTLAAAVFPETGVPEFPRASGPPIAQNQSLPQQVMSSNPPNTQTNYSNINSALNLPPHFQSMSLQQKKEFANRLIATRRMMQQQQANLTGTQGQQPAIPPDLNFSAILNAMPNTPQNIATMNSMSAFLSGGLGGINTAQTLSNYMGIATGGQMYPSSNTNNSQSANLGISPSPQGSQNQNNGPPGMQNLSIEMLQSFMQRNPEGSSSSSAG